LQSPVARESSRNLFDHPPEPERESFVQAARSDESSAGQALPPPPVADDRGQPDLPPPPTKFEVPPAVAAPEPLQLTETAPVAALPPENRIEPEVSDPLEDWHRGDVPMIRNWHKILGYQALLAAAMFAGPASADDEAKKNSDKAGAVDGKAIKDQLDRIENKLGSIDTLKIDVGGLKKEIELMGQA